jgi:hypothetical protein
VTPAALSLVNVYIEIQGKRLSGKAVSGETVSEEAVS